MKKEYVSRTKVSYELLSVTNLFFEVDGDWNSSVCLLTVVCSMFWLICVVRLCIDNEDIHLNFSRWRQWGYFICVARLFIWLMLASLLCYSSTHYLMMGYLSYIKNKMIFAPVEWCTWILRIFLFFFVKSSLAGKPQGKVRYLLLWRLHY